MQLQMERPGAHSASLGGLGFFILGALGVSGGRPLAASRPARLYFSGFLF